MTPPLTTEQRTALLNNPPPEKSDPFPHLAELSIPELLQHRVVLSGQIKVLEQERQEVDQLLMESHSSAELKWGLSAPGGWTLKQRTRTSWQYSARTREVIKQIQQQAQHDGEATPVTSTYLTLTKASA